MDLERHDEKNGGYVYSDRDCALIASALTKASPRDRATNDFGRLLTRLENSGVLGLAPGNASVLAEWDGKGSLAAFVKRASDGRHI